MQRYQNVDLKNYNDWHESHFSGLLGDVRIIRDRFRETRQLICEVYEESQISKCPLHEAYRRITLGIKSSPQPHSSRESSSGNFHSSSSSEQTDFDSNEQGFDEFLSEAFERYLAPDPLGEAPKNHMMTSFSDSSVTLAKTGALAKIFMTQ